MKTVVTSILLILTLSLLTSLATAEVVLDPADISWSTENGVVTFTLPFYNDEQVPSEPMAGELFAQEFGAFLPDIMSIGPFGIPEIQPESFFDVFVEIPYDQLPPPAEERFDWVNLDKTVTCGSDWHWDGNVDVIWGPAGGPTVQSHMGTLHVCPGYGGSYIHVITACNGNTTWNFTGVCAGFTANLLDEGFTNAPAVLLPGFTGWVSVTAVGTVPHGTTCNINLNLTCNGVTVPVQLSVLTCDCGTPVEAEDRTWGSIKSLYR